MKLKTHNWLSSNLFIFIVILLSIPTLKAKVPIVLNTWKFVDATTTAWSYLKQDVDRNNSAKNALVAGCTVCEVEQCDHTVGYGGSPDENGETTLDALIFDGTSMDMGAIGGLRRIKNVIGVARDVLELTEHSILAGDLATEFAKSLGYKEESLETNYSLNVWKQWKNARCQPNFWKNVSPDPKQSCGPYKPKGSHILEDRSPKDFSDHNHDTIGMIVIDEDGNVIAGTSTNGASHKIAGRVGDSPIPGAGAYADSEIGGAVATGDGDVMMRFLPAFLAVEEMRRGSSPTQASEEAIRRIRKRFPSFFGAVLASDNKGVYGAACNGMDEFPFCVANDETGETVVKSVKCIVE